MPVTGAMRFFYLFDVADTIDLSALRTVSGEGVTAAPLPLRPQTSPGYIQFPVPPLVGTLPDTQANGVRLAARAKFFDYGVISIRLSAPFSGEWPELLQLSRLLRADDALAAAAKTYLAPILSDIAHALDDPHAALEEDYFIAELTDVGSAKNATALLQEQGSNLAQLLLNETKALSNAEIEEALRVRFSYYEDDLAIIQWDSAVIYEDPEGASAIEDILEFANSQLVELRTYDAQLDGELDSIYAAKPARIMRSFFGRRAAEQASALRYLLVDVLELIDRSSNALKIIGDAYYARIYRGAAGRLGLAEWQRQLDSKLESVRDFYRYLNDQAKGSRDEFLEMIIILLIAIEVVLGFLTLHR